MANSNPMNLSRRQRNILIGKGDLAKGTYSSSKKPLEYFGGTASTKSIFQGTQLFSSKWQQISELCVFFSWYLVISLIGLGHTEKTVIFINQLDILSRVGASKFMVSNTRYIFTILDQLYSFFYSISWNHNKWWAHQIVSPIWDS